MSYFPSRLCGRKRPPFKYGTLPVRASAVLTGLANASKKSHAELDDADELDEGDPAELAAAYAELRKRLPNLNVVGGCCGTDHRHIDAISAAVTR